FRHFFVLTPAVQNRLLQVPSGRSLVSEQSGVHDRRLGHTDKDWPPPVPALILCGRTVLVGEVASPASFNPARYHGSSGPLAKNMPDSLSKGSKRLIFTTPEHCFRENDHAIPSIDRVHALF